MDTTTFANKIRTKFPDAVSSDGRKYTDIPDRELTQKIVEKYPTYKSQITDFDTPTPPTDEGKFVGGTLGKQIEGLKTLYGGGEGGIANKLKQDIQAGAEDIQKGNVVKGVAKAGLRTAGDVAGTVFAPIGAAVGAVTEATGIDKGFNWLGEKIGELTGITDIPAVQKWAMAHPNAADDFTRILNLATAGAEKGKIEPGTALERTGTQVKSMVDTGVKTVENMRRDIAANKFNKATELAKEPVSIAPEKIQQVAWEDIQPKTTAGTKRAYGSKSANVTEQGLFKGAKILPTEADKPVLDTYQKLYQDGSITTKMSPKEKLGAVEQKASQLHQQQKGFLADNDKVVDPNIGLFDKLKIASKENTIPFSKDAAAKGAYDSAIETFTSKIGDGPVTLTKIDDALTKFDDTMDKFGAWERELGGELTDTDKARIGAIRDVHTIARDYIAEQLPPNSPWKAIRAEESNLYRAGKGLTTRLSDTVGKGRIAQYMSDHPLVRRGLIWSGYGALGALGFKSATNMMSQ